MSLDVLAPKCRIPPFQRDTAPCPSFDPALGSSAQCWDSARELTQSPAIQTTSGLDTNPPLRSLYSSPGYFLQSSQKSHTKRSPSRLIRIASPKTDSTAPKYTNSALCSTRTRPSYLRQLSSTCIQDSAPASHAPLFAHPSQTLTQTLPSWLKRPNRRHRFRKRRPAY